MQTIGSMLSGAAGIIVLAGYFIPSLNQQYFLVPIGGALALISAVIISSSRPNYPVRY
jgi:hypothetical protein